MKRKINLFIKRVIDILGSGIGLIIVSPLFVLVTLLIKLTMPGPVFFKQERVGINLKLFRVLKFRTMKVDKEAESTFNSNKDLERMTTLGKLLRRTKIDELPQLINVFRGDMSLVGPRPTIRIQVDKYTTYQMQRLSMRPGMTGAAQVNGNITLPWEQRIEYDVDYIRNFNVILDIKILFKTVAIVVFGEERFKKERVIVNSGMKKEAGLLTPNEKYKN